MRLIAGLLIAFSILFIGVAVVSFLAEHLSDLSIWNSPFWNVWKVPLIIFGVVLCISMLLYINYRITLKNEKAERELALAQGWGYSHRADDTQGLIPKISAILDTVYPEKQFSLTGSVFTVPSEKGKFYLFPCMYNSRNTKKNSSPGSACLIESDRFSGMRSHVEIFPKNVLDSALTFNKVAIGDSEFQRGYIVSSQDPADAQRVVNESMQAMLTEFKNSPGFIGNFEIALGPGGAVILNWSQALPDDWLALADMARRFASAMR